MPAICRFCMEESDEADLIAPCECSGTQRFVHSHCLHRWQALSLRNRLRCPVCQRCYKQDFILSSYAPARGPMPRGRVMQALYTLTRPLIRLATALAIPCLVWAAHARWAEYSLPLLLTVFLLSLCCALPSLPFWCALVVDETGNPSWQLIRRGARLDGLRAGCLLVATHHIRAGIFRRSVLVITEHGTSTGALGYILNSPLDETASVALSQHALQATWRAVPWHLAAIACPAYPSLCAPPLP